MGEHFRLGAIRAWPPGVPLKAGLSQGFPGPHHQPLGAPLRFPRARTVRGDSARVALAGPRVRSTSPVRGLLGSAAPLRAGRCFVLGAGLAPWGRGRGGSGSGGTARRGGGGGPRDPGGGVSGRRSHPAALPAPAPLRAPTSPPAGRAAVGRARADVGVGVDGEPGSRRGLGPGCSGARVLATCPGSGPRVRAALSPRRGGGAREDSRPSRLAVWTPRAAGPGGPAPPFSDAAVPLPGEGPRRGRLVPSPSRAPRAPAAGRSGPFLIRPGAKEQHWTPERLSLSATGPLHARGRSLLLTCPASWPGTNDPGVARVSQQA